jgi:hypothetical protein
MSASEDWGDDESMSMDDDDDYFDTTTDAFVQQRKVRRKGRKARAAPHPCCACVQASVRTHAEHSALRVRAATARTGCAATLVAVQTA